MSDLVLPRIRYASSDVFSLCRFEGHDSESSAIAAKRYELCNAAANRITSIVRALGSLPVDI